VNKTLREKQLVTGQTLRLVQGDITTEKVDAIVNAANEHLQHGGGVAGVIARRGGPSIQAESDAWVKKHGAVPHEKPAFTSAGELPCRYVIHAVGPVWGSGDEDAKLASAVTGALERAEELKLSSLSFPAISTGIFGFPKERAAKVIIHAVYAYFDTHPSSSINEIRLTLFDQPTVDAFVQVFQ